MASLLGTVSGKFTMDITQAVAAYASVRAANSATTTALTKSAVAFNTIGNAMLGMGLGIAAGLLAAADEAGKFNQTMDYFQSISGATVSQMDAIKNKAIELDQTTMFSTTDIANMFVQLAKSGESTQTILGGVADACVDLAQAAQVPLADATQAVVVTMSAFNIQASQAAEVANILTGAANNSVLSLGDLSSSLKYVGGAANELGVSLPDTVSALDLLAKAGISGSMGGTELRQIMVSLSAPTAAATKEMKSLGLITKSNSNLFFDQEGNLKDLGSVFQLLQGKLAGMTAEQQAAALKTLFNNRAISAAAILTNQGAAGFANMNAEIAKTSAASTAAAQMDNLAGDTKKLTSSIKTLAIEAGQPLQNFLRQTVQGLTQVVHWFGEQSVATQNTIIYVLAYSAATLIMLGSLAKLIAFILETIATFRKMGEAFVFLGRVAAALWDVLEGLFTAFLAADPIVWVIAAVVALGVAFYVLFTKCTAFRNAMDDVGRAFKTGFEATVNWFKTLPTFFEHVWADIKQWFSDGVQWIVKTWNSIISFFQRLPGDVGHALSSFGSMLLSFFESIPGMVERGLTTAGNAVVTFFSNLPYYIGYAIGLVLGTLVRFDIAAALWAYHIGTDVVGAVINFFEKLPGRVIGFLDRMMNDWNNFWEAMWGDTEKFGAEVVNGVVNFFEKLPGEVIGFFDQVMNDWNTFWENMWGATERFGTQVYNGIIGFFERLPGDIGTFFTTIKNDFGQWITDAVSAAGRWGLGVINAVINEVKALPGQVEGIFNNCISAIEGVISSAFNAAKNFASGLWNGFKKGLGINSPSFIEKSMTQIGVTMDTETKKISGYVKQIQGLGSQLQNYNPATTAAAYTSGQIGALGNSMVGQLSQLQAIQKAIGNNSTGYNLTQSANSGAGSSSIGTGAPTKVLEVNVYNPVAESSSTSATQQLRTLASMGAF